MALEQRTSVARPRANRKLEPAEVEALVWRYREGATVYELAEEFGMHRQTVSAHLHREGVALRSRVRMTPRLLARATELYEAGWSTVRIGKELGLGTSTVGKALKRSGVAMRPPAAERWK
ncbi:sigma factor-like helix-turn-helix DNA-binding protein [Rhodococcus sp. NPDC003382]